MRFKLAQVLLHKNREHAGTDEAVVTLEFNIKGNKGIDQLMTWMANNASVLIVAAPDGNPSDIGFRDPTPEPPEIPGDRA